MAVAGAEGSAASVMLKAAPVVVAREAVRRGAAVAGTLGRSGPWHARSGSSWWAVAWREAPPGAGGKADRWLLTPPVLAALRTFRQTGGAAHGNGRSWMIHPQQGDKGGPRGSRECAGDGRATGERPHPLERVGGAISQLYFSCTVLESAQSLAWIAQAAPQDHGRSSS